MTGLSAHLERVFHQGDRRTTPVHASVAGAKHFLQNPSAKAQPEAADAGGIGSARNAIAPPVTRQSATRREP
jgi:hypothetical protein